MYNFSQYFYSIITKKWYSQNLLEALNFSNKEGKVATGQVSNKPFENKKPALV
jgi:hypothetical protein